MFRRLRKALFGDPRHEVLGGGDSDDTAFASGASLGGVGAVSDHHRGHTDESASSPVHGDDEFKPQVPPDPS